MRPPLPLRRTRRTVIAASVALTAGMTVLAGPAFAAPAESATEPADVGSSFMGDSWSTGLTATAAAIESPLLPSECQEQLGGSCYAPEHVQRAYRLDELHRRGITGRGTTLAVVMPLGHPTVQADMNRFSEEFGLPPADIEVIEFGDVRPADPEDPLQAQNMQETNLDLQMMHAVAPEADLILVSTATNLSSGTAGWQDISDAIEWLADHRDVDAISMSYGSYEEHFPEQAGQDGNYELVEPLREGFRAADRAGITLLAASGNTGQTGPNLSGTALYEERTAAWPASDPLVTGVGATDLHLDDQGERTAPDELWSRDAARGGASGAARSRIWPHQTSVDITAIGGDASRFWVYSSVNVLPGQNAGWTRIAGTSAASPAMAGMVALAAQQAGRPLGNISPDLARIWPGTHGTTDLTSGCNTLPMVPAPGHCAHWGQDVASGIGTVRDAPAFTRALAAMNRG